MVVVCLMVFSDSSGLASHMSLVDEFDSMSQNKQVYSAMQRLEMTCRHGPASILDLVFPSYTLSSPTLASLTGRKRDSWVLMLPQSTLHICASRPRSLSLRPTSVV